MTPEALTTLRTASKKLGTVDRKSADSAREVLAALFPDKSERRTAIQLLADAIQTVHKESQLGWSITLFHRCVRLNVGKALVLEFLPDTVWLAADSAELSDATRDQAALFLVEESPFQVLPASTHGYAAAAADLSTLIELVETGRTSTLMQAAKTQPGKSAYKKAWSPGVVDLLEQELKQPLPRPDWHGKHLVTSARRTQLEKLLAAFAETYLGREPGKKHVAQYAAVNNQGPSRLAAAAAADPETPEGIDTILANLLPHNDTTYNRDRGAWTHYAPAVTRDLRQWFEGAGWTAHDSWPQVCRDLVGLYHQLDAAPDELETACAKFAAGPTAKGFGAGLVSPLLHALHPGRFLLLNNKSRGVVNWLAGTNHAHGTADYPAANQTAWALIDELAGLLTEHGAPELEPATKFDIFTHWLVAIRMHPTGKTRYWKVSPAADATRWDDCRSSGCILIGWDDLGDLTGATKAQYEQRRDALAAAGTYTKQALDQVWRFRNIREGDWIVANKGTHTVVGIGLVAGPYYFVQGDSHPHRLPVEWVDVEPRAIERGGWRKTLIPLTRETFEAVSAPAKADTSPTTPETGLGEKHPDAAFGPRAFELLGLLEATPRLEVYTERKAEFVEHVETPFKELFKKVIAGLPTAITVGLETKRRLFGQIPKNDWGQGGAWPYYWGAMYPEGEKRRTAAQMFVGVRASWLSFGMSVGSLAVEPEKRFVQNLVQHRQALEENATDLIEDRSIYFGRDEEPGKPPPTTAHDWLDAPAEHEVRAEARLTPAELVSMPRAELVETITRVFHQVWPLYLLAADEDPTDRLAAWWDDPDEESDDDELPLRPAYSFEELTVDCHLPADRLRLWLAALERKRQAVLFGPPGTGKTWVAQKMAAHLVAGTPGFVDLLQLHPAYAYEDFMQGIRPVAGKGGLSYRTVEGRFLEFCRRARDVGGAPCVLILDEINRANLSRVFGELMYLLEYREAEIPLSGGGSFSIPANVRILGTMNTADRSIALVDHALRRRFAFLELEPIYEVLTAWHSAQATGFDPKGLIKALKRVNAEIGDANHSVGISFFLLKDLAVELEGIWRMEIEPYLAEYFFDRPGTLKQLRWDVLGPKIVS